MAFSLGQTIRSIFWMRLGRSLTVLKTFTAASM